MVAELKMVKDVNALKFRQRRILAGLARGDLIWEVPEESFFTQFNEATGRARRLRLDELSQMQESGWIHRVSQGPNRLDHWEITDEGRRVGVPTPRKRGRPKKQREIAE